MDKAVDHLNKVMLLAALNIRDIPVPYKLTERPKY